MRYALLSVAVLLAGCAGSSEPADRGDLDVVEAEDTARTVRRVENMLRGQVAGVRVEQRPNGQLAIRIRGASNAGLVGSTSDPLFVIDGLPIELGADGALDGLNPRDIASIRVLKNASDTAMYGSRGANGVVLITTVRPPSRADSAPSDSTRRGPGGGGPGR